MTRSLIEDDAAFAIVLAAWWQLRRSAHLLPHLRRGPSSFFFNPGRTPVSWIMVIVTQRVSLPVRRARWRPQDVVGAPTVATYPAPVMDPPTCPFPVVGPRSSGPATAPLRPPDHIEPPTQPKLPRRGAA